MFQVALRAPPAVGTNCAPIEQLEPGSSLPLFAQAVCPLATGAVLKSPTCPVPGTTNGLPSVIATEALLVRRTLTVGLVLPTAVLPNITELGDAAGVGNGANGGGGGGVTAA